MLNAKKIFSAALFALVVLVGSNQVQADTGTYEMGPFLVYGMGGTEAEAESNAYGEAWDIIAAIESTLGPDEWVSDFVVEDEGLVTPTMYSLKFHIVITYTLPDLPIKGGSPGN
ncbi:MAG: hypothetical protein ACI87E_003190 [Mariniblastus sp.]|jgi:hypothetical protein